MMSTAPSERAGACIVMVVLVRTAVAFPGTPSKVTVAPLWKPVPVMTTLLATSTSPVVGTTDATLSGPDGVAKVGRVGESWPQADVSSANTATPATRRDTVGRMSMRQRSKRGPDKSQEIRRKFAGERRAEGKGPRAKGGQKAKGRGKSSVLPFAFALLLPNRSNPVPAGIDEIAVSGRRQRRRGRRPDYRGQIEKIWAWRHENLRAARQPADRDAARDRHRAIAPLIARAAELRRRNDLDDLPDIPRAESIQERRRREEMNRGFDLGLQRDRREVPDPVAVERKIRGKIACGLFDPLLRNRRTSGVRFGNLADQFVDRYEKPRPQIVELPIHLRLPRIPARHPERSRVQRVPLAIRQAIGQVAQVLLHLGPALAIEGKLAGEEVIDEQIGDIENPQPLQQRGDVDRLQRADVVLLNRRIRLQVRQTEGDWGRQIESHWDMRAQYLNLTAICTVRGIYSECSAVSCPNVVGVETLSDGNPYCTVLNRL